MLIKEIEVIETDILCNDKIGELELPAIITNQAKALNELSKSINGAKKKAKDAYEKADAARDMSAGFGQKKTAIEGLQEAGVTAVNAIMSITEAQKVSFEFHEKLTEITRYLFMLGTGSIAMNRATVRQLKLQMEGASRKKLTKLAEEEMKNVIRQLNYQQDIMVKQHNIEQMTKNHDIELDAISKELEQQVENNKKHADGLESIINKLAQIEVENNRNEQTHASLSDSISSLLKEDERIATVFERLETEVASLNKVSCHYATTLSVHDENHTRQFDFINELELTARALKESSFAIEDNISEIHKVNRKMWKSIIIAYIIGGSSVIVGLIALLLSILLN